MRDTTGVTQTLAFEIQNGLITALYLVRNPDKLRHVHAPVESGTTPAN
jgi:RNA polymerase sigma-70 factor (ECF subfamily)